MASRYDPGAYRDVFDRHFTFLAGFWRNTHRYAERLALRDGAREWTYAELGVDVARVAAGLAARGVVPGDVVTFQLFNSAEFALLYLASQHLGAVASPINFRFSSGETAHVLDDSEPRVFVHDASLAATTEEALRLATHRPDTVLSTGPDFESLLAAGEKREPYDGGSTWDETIRLYTSGTTGVPKGVSLPSVAEVLTAHDVIMHFPLDPRERTLNMTAR
jgi:acyl-CoA synthetase (AMP-forming)/AMP-acid ligase II